MGIFRGLAVLAAVSLAIVLGGCGDGAALDRLASAGRGRVVEVMPAGLVRLDDGRTIKLAGVTVPRSDEPFGEAARVALADLVMGREVELLAGGAALDPFGRRVAHLRLVEGRGWVEEKLLAAGAARVRTFADNRAMAAAMLDHEARARAAGRGLWAEPAYRVLLPGEAMKQGRGFVLVEGRVASVRPGYDGQDLSLGSGLSVRLSSRALADFEAAGKAPGKLTGKLVRVRGTLRYDGTLRLDHPEALEVLKAA